MGNNEGCSVGITDGMWVGSSDGVTNGFMVC